ncbi:hypothetical protein L7F22_043660 [Adiantum nelumboides]|nr:hypothetical protein [Adiantum nelumboides]
MLTKITKWASWAITIAILQHLILTTLATPVSVNGFNSIEKRSEGANLEERYVDNRKFAYNAGDPTGQGPAKRSPVFKVGSLERFVNPKAYSANQCLRGYYCRRSVQSVGELFASLKKRAPIIWGTPSTIGKSYFFGKQCGKDGCHKNRRSISSISESANPLEERAPTQLQKRSQIPSDIENPMEIGSLRRTIDDLSDEMTIVLFRKHFIPPNFAKMFRFWPGTTKRELFDSNEGMANVMVKSTNWLEWFRGHLARTRRQELASDENETQILTRRWAPYCWWCRYMAAGGSTRKRRFLSDGFSNDERRSNLNENLMLFNERWNGVMESYDETLDQVKRSSILEPFLMYWTMLTRRSFKDRIQFTKREPTWANWLSYRPGTHRRSIEEEKERETQYTPDQLQLVKRSPIFRYGKFFWGAPPRRSIEELETNAKTEIVLISGTSITMKKKWNVNFPPHLRMLQKPI